MSTQLANRLQNYEASPPPGAWQFIANELKNGNEQISLSQKLHNYEVSPPANAWTNISSRLNKAGSKNKTKIRTLLYKLTAAAVIAGIISVGGFYYFSKNSIKNQFVIQEVVKKPDSKKGNAPDPAAFFHPSPLVQPLALLNKATNVLSRKRKRFYQKSDDKFLRNAVVDNILFTDTLISIMINTKPIRNEKGDIIQNLSLLNNGNENYINITSPNGEQTKISSKFLHALLYLRDNNYLDNFHGHFDKSFLESLIWKIRFQSWRKKLLASTLIPSSNNYLDIFEFKDLITKDSYDN